MSLSFGNAGQLKLNRKLQMHNAILVTSFKIRQALKRRALAYDLAKLLCDFQTVSEIAMAQLRESDKQLFLQISNQVRGALTLRPDGTKPMQKALLALKDHPQVQFCLIPARKPSARFAPYELGLGKENKGKGKSKGSGTKVRFRGAADTSRLCLQNP